ncbi:hypothetical protein NKH77_49485 [Streptomyces sp. M19]
MSGPFAAARGEDVGERRQHGLGLAATATGATGPVATAASGVGGPEPSGLATTSASRCSWRARSTRSSGVNLARPRACRSRSMVRTAASPRAPSSVRRTSTWRSSAGERRRATPPWLRAAGACGWRWGR